jgi:hypothetical protein
MGDDATKNQEQWDKERQRADQETANARKAREEATLLRNQIAQQQAESAAMRKQFEELSATVNAGRSVVDALPDLDVENASTADLAAAIKKAGTLITEQAKELARLQTKAKQYEEESAADKAARVAREQADQTLNEVCEELDAEFGAGYRNEAIKLMQTKNAEQGRPESPAKAVLRLRSCYREIKESKAKENKAKNPPHTDTGGGGSRPSFGGKQIKKGSLDEVAAQVAAANAG